MALLPGGGGGVPHGYRGGGGPMVTGGGGRGVPRPLVGGRLMSRAGAGFTADTSRLPIVPHGKIDSPNVTLITQTDGIARTCITSWGTAVSYHLPLFNMVAYIYIYKAITI